MTVERPMFPPQDSSRRGFLTLVGGASAAAAALISQPAFAAPAEPLETSKASPALRDAVKALADSHDSLEAAKARFNEADAKMTAWDDENPQPAGKRAYKRWARRFHDAREAIVGESWDAQLEAERHFAKAQMAVAKIRPAHMNDLALMAAAAAIYDKTLINGFQRCVISYGVSLGLFAVLPGAS